MIHRWTSYVSGQIHRPPLAPRCLPCRRLEEWLVSSVGPAHIRCVVLECLASSAFSSSLMTRGRQVSSTTTCPSPPLLLRRPTCSLSHIIPIFLQKLRWFAKLVDFDALLDYGQRLFCHWGVCFNLRIFFEDTYCIMCGEILSWSNG